MVSVILPIEIYEIMETKLTTRFTVASDETVSTLLVLTKAIAREKYAKLLPAETLENYIGDNFDVKRLRDDLNSMSNQWLVVYSEGSPAGYARVTSKGERPDLPHLKRMVRIADFGILSKFDDLPVRQLLLDKCLSASRSYQAVWIQEYAENPFLSFFENNDFVIQGQAPRLYELPLSSVCLVRENL
jgi:hypothetical protein